MNQATAIQNGWERVTLDDLENRRTALKMTKAAMAKALGVTPSTYYNWCKGSSVPTESSQQRIKARLDSLSSPVLGKKLAECDVNDLLTNYSRTTPPIPLMPLGGQRGLDAASKMKERAAVVTAVSNVAAAFASAGASVDSVVEMSSRLLDLFQTKST